MAHGWSDDLGRNACESHPLFAKVAHDRKLAVAPVTLADTVLKKIAEQTELARGGEPARIYAKMNALVDLAVVDAL